MGNPQPQVLGYYSIPSAIAVIDAPFRQRRMQRADEPIADDELRDDLTRRHEFAHYRQIMTTPFGFLLWRCFNALISDIEYIAAAVASRDPVPDWQVPLHDWVRSGGLQPAGADDRRFDYLLHVCRQVDVLQAFLGALIGPAHHISVGDFVHNCQQAFEEVCRRSDLDCRIRFVSHRPAHEMLAPPGMLSGAELMEAATRLEERLLLEDLPDAASRIERWEEGAIHGVYEAGYRWLMAQTGDAKAALALIDIAFMSPFDPAFLDAGGDVCIEDLLPTHRLPRLVSQARQHFWSDDAAELDRLMGTELCAALGLETPLAVAIRGAAATYHGPQSWGSDFSRRGGPAHLNPGRVFDHFDRECRRAMALRRDTPSAVHREPRHDDIGFRPALVFYRDTVIFGIGDQDTPSDSIALVAGLFRKFLHDEQLLRLIGMPPSHDNESLCRRLRQRMAQPAADGDWFTALVGSLRVAGIDDAALDRFFFGDGPLLAPKA